MRTSYTLLAIALCFSLLFVACSNSDIDAAKAEAKNLSDRVTEMNAALQNAQTQVKDISQQVQEKGAMLQECLANETQLQNKSKTLIDSLGNDLAAAHDDLKTCEAKAAKMDAYTAIVADAARRICCAQRVERPEIDSFSLDNEKIVCKSKGDTKLSC